MTLARCFKGLLLLFFFFGKVSKSPALASLRFSKPLMLPPVSESWHLQFVPRLQCPRHPVDACPPLRSRLGLHFLGEQPASPPRIFSF